MINEFPQVVTIGGSDSDGSAGIQADLYTFFARKTHGMSILTAAVAGNSYGIHAAHALPLDFIDAQFKALNDDFELKAAKTGMLADATLIHNVAENLQRVNFGYLVVDPVISTKHGATLLELAAVDTLKAELLPLADVTTPNFYEAEILANMQITSPADQMRAAERIQQLGVKNVMVKGQHGIDANQEMVRDYVLLADGEGFWLEGKFVNTDHINGTGDTLSSIIVAELAKGNSVKAAIQLANQLTLAAITHEIEVGHKYGPINHWAVAD